MKILQRINNKTSTIILTILIAVLVVGVALSALHFIGAFRAINSAGVHLSPDGSFSNTGSPESEIINVLIDQAIDGGLTSSLIAEFKVRNDESYPSERYLNDAVSSGYFLFYEKIEIKSEDDRPSDTALPPVGELHIWPGYGCSLGSRPPYPARDEVGYGELIFKHDDTEHSFITLRPDPTLPDALPLPGNFVWGKFGAKLAVSCFSQERDETASGR
ncbi:hypothetical protein F4X86_04110 [Candidatus Saccharibacteria bacterium]|nr:hypothetical protein [Candidatus Saccharibacteria bacterium]